jgi:putative DNA primase/helicase
MSDDAGNDLDELRAALRGSALESLALDIKGEPTFRSRRELRWGRKGSLRLKLDRGTFTDFEAGVRGGPLDFLMHAGGLGFADAVARARAELGFPDPVDRPQPSAAARRKAEAEAAARKATETARREKQAVETAADEARRIREAQHLAAEAVPPAGSVAEWYLRNERGIATPSAGWPDAVRFHAGSRALLLVATAADGTAKGVQRVFLDEIGQKLDAEELAARGLPAAKLSRGVLKGAAVRLPSDRSGPLLLAEGPETGLSGWTATGYETWIALGGVGGSELPAGRRVVVLGEDHPRFHQAAKGLRDALARWRRQGRQVVVATPWAKHRWDKSDLNDTLRELGPGAVRARIERGRPPPSA